MKVFAALTSVLLTLSIATVVTAQTTSSISPTQITEIKRVPLPIFKTADIDSLLEELSKKRVAKLRVPLPILEISDSGMYLVEIEGQRVWVVDSTVRVDATAKASEIAAEGMNFSDKDLAATRGYGD